jgi:predicted transposase YbfD/YdcC
MVESVRELNGETTVETRYFISSLEDNAQKFANSIRSHWGIENSLHWILDVGLNVREAALKEQMTVV